MGAEIKTQPQDIELKNGKPYPLVFTKERAVKISEMLTAIVNHEIKMGRDTATRNPEKPFDEFLGKIVAGATRSQGALVFVDRNLLTEVRTKLWAYIQETSTNPTVDKKEEQMIGTMARLDATYAGASGTPAIPKKNSKNEGGNVAQRFLRARMKRP